MHAYLLKGVCDFTFKSLALWEFLFVSFFFQMTFVNGGNGIGVHCRTERECLDCVIYGRYFVLRDIRYPVKHCFRSSVSWLSLFFSNYHHLPFNLSSAICGIQFLFFFLLDFCFPCSYLVHATRPLFMIIHLCPFEFPISQ